ncbi:MAG: cupin domain-containing protein [Chloroflexi bacterium]|nr:cupin domain-containing protein [Chloroflexota bacterium]
MFDQETKASRQGTARANFYQEALRQAKEEKERAAREKTVIRHQEMPWEDCPQGKLKHLVNEKMDTRLRSLDIYMQELPPGGRSGKHRHMAEEYIYVLEGKGYDIHWDVDVEIKDKYDLKVQEQGTRHDWEAGDAIWIPINTAHQHFNADPAKPARFISSTNRVYKLVGFNDLEQLEDAPSS